MVTSKGKQRSGNHAQVTSIYYRFKLGKDMLNNLVVCKYITPTSKGFKSI